MRQAYKSDAAKSAVLDRRRTSVGNPTDWQPGARRRRHATVVGDYCLLAQLTEDDQAR